MITLSDIDLAAASQALVVGFNLEPSDAVMAHAKQRGVTIMTYKVDRLTFFLKRVMFLKDFTLLLSHHVFMLLVWIYCCCCLIAVCPQPVC